MNQVLNLYAGLGGNRKHWENCQVTAIEQNFDIAEAYAKNYPDDTVIVTDAHQFLLDHFDKFDFIWSSPPCQSHSQMNLATKHQKKRYPDLKLYEEILFLRQFCKTKWVVENVRPYYKPLIPAQVIGRHYFWSNFHINALDVDRPSSFINQDTFDGALQLMEWLGIYVDKPIYYDGNHCPAQVLRNCVHPSIGLDVFNSAMDYQQHNQSAMQPSLMEFQL